MLQISSTVRKSKDEFGIGLTQSAIERTGRAEQPREQQEVVRQLNTLFDEEANGENRILLGKLVAIHLMYRS